VRGAPGAQQLVKLDVATGRVETISTLPNAYVITGPYGGPTRMALSPDGKSVYTTIREMEGDIWILEGFNPPHSSWEWRW
jgi:hypothetical protein